ncbi:MAG: hypothetical protein HYZ32_05065, partial [Hydrocarboniphaga effusa]|nr:hypothetical protein [Hydrocarboniphaga effusa]
MTSSTVRNRLRARDLVGLLATGYLFFAATTGAAAAATGCGMPMEPGRYDMVIRSEGEARNAVYYIPSDYTGERKVPLVFDFHGSNSHPRGQLNRSHWDLVAEREGFIVMALEGSLDGALAGTHAWNVPGVNPLAGVSREGRLDEGKVYLGEHARQARENFFTPANLTALRELAMRAAAERIDLQMQSLLRRHKVQGPWPTRDRLLVCVGGNAVGKSLIRAAARLADLRGAQWIAVHVINSRANTLPNAVKDQIAETPRLAAELG